MPQIKKMGGQTAAPAPEAEHYAQPAFPNEFTDPLVDPDKLFGQLIEGGDEEDGSNIPLGRYEAVLTLAVMRKVGERGRSVLMEFVVASPDHSGKKLTAWFNVVTKEGERGSEFPRKQLAATFAKLGYKPTARSIIDDLKEITDEKPGVMIAVKYSSDERRFQNVTLERKVETELTEELREALAAKAANRPY